MFVSASKRQATTFIYTTAPTGNLLKGANNSGSQPWGGATRDATPFSNGDVSVDSDAAYKAAAKGGGLAGEEQGKARDSVCSGTIGTTARSDVVCDVGDKKAGGYAVYVNASTGKVFGK